MRRRSRQRERILFFLRGTETHPTAQEVFEALKGEFPGCSLGNTYRNIRILVEEGRVASRIFKDGVEHFDADARLHYHFVCERCGSISDLKMPVQTGLEKEAERFLNRPVRSHMVQFFGLCGRCAKKSR